MKITARQTATVEIDVEFGQCFKAPGRECYYKLINETTVIAAYPMNISVDTNTPKVLTADLELISNDVFMTAFNKAMESLKELAK